MIKPGEIQKIARKCVVRDTQIEKGSEETHKNLKYMI